MTDQPASTPAPGWYPDGADEQTLRRWDGSAWTDETRPTNWRSPQTLVVLGIIGIVAVYLVFALWLHPGYPLETAIYAVTLGPVLSGAVVPRSWDDSDARTIKRTLTSILTVAAVTMFFTNDPLLTAITGVVGGLMAAGFYTFIDNVTKASKQGQSGDGG